MSEPEKNPYLSPQAEGRWPKRRWFLYSLSTFLVVTSLTGCFLAYNFNWILQRNQCFFGSMNRTGCGPVTASPGDAPWSIRILGARGHESIGVAKNSAEEWNDEDVAVKAEISRLFPEARVYVVTYSELQIMQEELEKQKSQSFNRPPLEPPSTH